jgi:hypothetical protein
MVTEPIFDIGRPVETALHQGLDPVLGGGAGRTAGVTLLAPGGGQCSTNVAPSGR